VSDTVDRSAFPKNPPPPPPAENSSDGDDHTVLYIGLGLLGIAALLTLRRWQVVRRRRTRRLERRWR
jgi:cytochrome oxidase assembly protein ShyY1